MIVRSFSLSVLCSIETMISLLADEQRGYDWATELKAFDETKSGVKGLVDEGITTIPQIFVQKPAETPDENLTPTQISIPVIDLKGIQTVSPPKEENHQSGPGSIGEVGFLPGGESWDPNRCTQ